MNFTMVKIFGSDFYTEKRITMAAKDYIFVEGVLGTVYLAKATKTSHLMSQDRRVVTDDEIIGLFEHYLKRWCEENNTTHLGITDQNGNEIFRAILTKNNNASNSD